nr:hypothetical protein [Deinococcus sp. Leaf326]
MSTACCTSSRKTQNFSASTAIHCPTRGATSENDAQAEQRRNVAENASFTLARRHVGAAGFLQHDVLEQIISAGRDQIEVTRSLHQVVTATQAQLQATQLTTTEGGQAHLDTLRDIVKSSEAQIRIATELRESIQHILTDVIGTPLEEVSGHLLRTLGEVVQQQLEELQNLITTALGEADTAQQRAKLQQVRDDTETLQVQVAHEQSERNLTQLELLGAVALERVRELEEGGRTHAAQRAELEQKAESTCQLISSLEQQEEQNLAKLANLEKNELKATERQHVLEARVQQTETELSHHHVSKQQE